MKKFVICFFVFVVGCGQEIVYEERFKYLQCSVSERDLRKVDWHPFDAGDYLISLQLEIIGDDLKGPGEHTSTFFRGSDVRHQSVSIRDFFVVVDSFVSRLIDERRTFYISREDLTIYDHPHENWRKKLGKCIVRSQQEFESEMERLTDKRQKLLVPLEEKEQQRRKDRVL